MLWNKFPIMNEIVLRLAKRRKIIRRYKKEKVDISKILYAIKATIQAPYGANQQPWKFIIVEDPFYKA